ncbi:MAG: hypothetical protein AAFU77_16040 [Myxococcota bacterium]
MTQIALDGAELDCGNRVPCIPSPVAFYLPQNVSRADEWIVEGRRFRLSSVGFSSLWGIRREVMVVVLDSVSPKLSLEYLYSPEFGLLGFTSVDSYGRHLWVLTTSHGPHPFKATHGLKADNE